MTEIGKGGRGADLFCFFYSNRNEQKTKMMREICKGGKGGRSVFLFETKYKKTMREICKGGRGGGSAAEQEFATQLQPAAWAGLAQCKLSTVHCACQCHAAANSCRRVSLG